MFTPSGRWHCIVNQRPDTASTVCTCPSCTVKRQRKTKWSEIMQSGGRPLFAFLSLLLLRVEKPYWSTQGLLDRWRITRNDLQTSSSSAIHKYVLDESIKGRKRRRRTSKGPSRPTRKDFICLFFFFCCYKSLLIDISKDFSYHLISSIFSPPIFDRSRECK